MKLDIENLTKKFGTQHVLCNINLHIPETRSIAFVGPSGGGKSTLLRTIAGLEVPSYGTIKINDQPLQYDEDALRAYRKQIGIVFQSWNLFPHLTALENICLPLVHVHGYSQEKAEATGLALLGRFDMTKHADKKPSALSGGQNQRVAIIRAIAIHPRLLLFDEPTSALDPLMTSEVLDLITELKQEGTDFIIVTHHISFAEKISDWCVFLKDGKVVESASTKEFFTKAKSKDVQAYIHQVLKY